jgi:hypothetical protein
MLLGPQASKQNWEVRPGFGRKQPPFTHSRPAGQPSLVLQTQPTVGSQTWPVGQSSAGPPVQVPSWQVSLVVQGLPSSQAPPGVIVVTQTPCWQDTVWQSGAAGQSAAVRQPHWRRPRASLGLHRFEQQLAASRQVEPVARQVAASVY